MSGPLPHDARAARLLLGGVIREPGLNAAAFTLVSAGDLYEYPHRLVWGACFGLWAAFRPVTLAGVYRELWRGGRAADLGPNPALYLADLFDADPTGASCLWAAGVVLREAARRRVVLRAHEMIRDARAGRLDTEEYLALA